jgi:hypothetical protein
MHTLLEQLQREIGAEIGGLDAAQMQLRPVVDPTKWSVQQGIEHLLLTYASTSNLFEKRLAKGRPTQAVPTFQHRLRQCVVLRCGYLPEGRVAPEEVTPPESPVPVTGEMLAARVHDALLHLDWLAVEMERRFSGAGAATHFALGPLSALQWRRFHQVHGRLHLRQIRAIRVDHGV